MSYTSSSIKVLKGLEACRTRPGMYIGNLEEAAFQMIKEVLDNSIDEHLAKHCNAITIKLTKTGYAVIEDNGRGIPVDIHESEGISAAIVIMTQLHAGGKFDQKTYKVSGGLHGVGVSVVNALSARLEMNIFRDGNEYFAAFEKGDLVEDLRVIGKSKKTGTRISFIPDTTIVENAEFELASLAKRLEEIAYLNPGLKINLIDEREEKEFEYYQPKGIVAFVEKFVTKKALHEIITLSVQDNDVQVDCAFVWTESYSENIKCFTNNIPQIEGGTHLVGLRTALTRTINNYLQKETTLMKKFKDLQLTGEDIREGIVGVMSIYMPEPQFSSQTKDKLVSAYIRSVVEKAVSARLEQWLEENPESVKEIFGKIQNAVFAREAARRSRDLVRNNKNANDINIGLAKTLYSCSEKDPTKAEIFLVEGESAGGSAKGARNPKYQAILPLRGKILNVEKADYNKMLNDEGIRNLIAAMGTGIGESFDITKIKYNKIILMTDADVDGSHILVLLITFFFKYMRSIIENGYLYVSYPPLYGIRQGNKVTYLLNDEALAEFLFNRNMDKIKLYQEEKIIEDKILKDYVKDAWKICKDLKNRSPIYEAFLMNKCEEKDLFNPEDLLQYLVSIKSGAWSYEDENYIYSNNGLIYKYNFTFDDVNEKYLNFINKWKEYWGKSVTFQYDSENKVLHSPNLLYTTINQKGNSGLSISRFKGLGEMEAEDLRDTVMNNGIYTRVTYNNEQNAEELINVLMGEDVAPRKEFLNKLDHIETDD